jgi:hypothetical protein
MTKKRRAGKMKRITKEEAKTAFSFTLAEGTPSNQQIEVAYRAINSDDFGIITGHADMLLQEIASTDRYVYVVLCALVLDVYRLVDSGEIGRAEAQSQIDKMFTTLKRMTPTVRKQLWDLVLKDSLKRAESPITNLKEVLYDCETYGVTPKSVKNKTIHASKYERDVNQLSPYKFVIDEE